MKPILVLILITLIPTLELRASIPYGILRADMHWWVVVLVCVVTNIVLGPLVYLFLDKAMGLLLRFQWLNDIYGKTVTRTQRRIQKSVDRYGEMGVALFIGIPLPGTGSYSGALGAYLLGLGYRRFIIANVIGVLMAGSIVTVVVLSGVEAFRVLIKIIQGDPISLFHSIILGIIQGVTEFLPVSSSGHLVILQGLFGMEEPRLFFNVMLHVGTLVAIIMVFWRDIGEIPKGIFAALRGNPGIGGFWSALWRCPQGRLIILIVVGSIPAALMGLAFEETLSSLFASPLFAGFMLMATGTILRFTRRKPSDSKGSHDMGVIDALIVGVGQAFALIPGISRSGITISFGLLRGMEREWSGKFSFLLAIPAILGALILECKMPSEIAQEELVSILAGTLVAIAVGYISLRTLMYVVKRGNLALFSYYCWGAGVLTIFLFMRWP